MAKCSYCIAPTELQAFSHQHKLKESNSVAMNFATTYIYIHKEEYFHVHVSVHLTN